MHLPLNWAATATPHVAAIDETCHWARNNWNWLKIPTPRQAAEHSTGPAQPPAFQSGWLSQKLIHMTTTRRQHQSSAQFQLLLIAVSVAVAASGCCRCCCCHLPDARTCAVREAATAAATRGLGFGLHMFYWWISVIHATICSCFRDAEIAQTMRAAHSGARHILKRVISSGDNRLNLLL